MFDAKLVVHFLDMRILRAYGDNFLPWETEILVKDIQGAISRVNLAEVKVVCFVKDFEGNPAKSHSPAPALIYQAVPGRKVRMRFRDGEVLSGLSSIDASPTTGFFVTPTNPNSNNTAIYVNPKALAQFRFED